MVQACDFWNQYRLRTMKNEALDLQKRFSMLQKCPKQHVDEFSISAELKKCLKGKSCFHIKKLTPELLEEIKAMIQKGVEVYLKADLI